MFVAYGIRGLVGQFDINFSIFYVSLCSVTMWIAFRFMSADKVLKYNVLGSLSQFNPKAFVDSYMMEDPNMGPIYPGSSGPTDGEGPPVEQVDQPEISKRKSKPPKNE
jgi:hypothetical protein